MSGAIVYWLNTEQHDPNREITFSRLFGFDAVGAIETVAVLLGMGMFFLGLGAFRWLREQGLSSDDDEVEGSSEATGASSELDGESR